MEVRIPLYTLYHLNSLLSSSILFSIVVTMKARDKYNVFIDEGEFTIC